MSRCITAKELKQLNHITATAIGGQTPYDFLKRVNTGDTVFYGIVDDSGMQYPLQINEVTASVKLVKSAPILIGDRSTSI